MINWDEKRNISGGQPDNSEQEALRIMEEYRSGRQNAAGVHPGDTAHPAVVVQGSRPHLAVRLLLRSWRPLLLAPRCSLHRLPRRNLPPKRRSPMRRKNLCRSVRLKRCCCA